MIKLSVIRYTAAQLYSCQRQLVGIVNSRTLAFCSMADEYEKAVIALNSLQSNASQIAKSVKERGVNAYKNPLNCLRNLKIVGVEKDDLNKLNVVHVSGTKGKGSTCALVESILRFYGYKTGLYTSPHLIEVRERIRINGKPISKEKFSKYFWDVYNELKNHVASKDDMPAYFAFLTVMAFKVFLEEKVDVAVIEVGIGGEFDQTNVVPKPKVVGIASLGFDHVNILGNTIEAIAKSKAGIFRESVAAFTVEQTYNNALKTLEENAEVIRCPLYVCPPLSEYSTTNGTLISIGIGGDAQKTNASLALQLCNHWLNEMKYEKQNVTPGLTKAKPFVITDEQLNGIRNCKWPGRCQIIRRRKISYFLDGAHTLESIVHCVEWFTRESKEQSNLKNVSKILLFNSTGERNVHSLMKPLTEINFDAVAFSTNTPFSDNSTIVDLIDTNADPEAVVRIVTRNCDLWRGLTNKNVTTTGFHCISDALKWIEEYTQDNIQVLVTGSLRLVGGVLSLIDPHMHES